MFRNKNIDLELNVQCPFALLHKDCENNEPAFWFECTRFELEDTENYQQVCQYAAYKEDDIGTEWWFECNNTEIELQ